MRQLPIFVNLHGRKVILLGTGEMADAKRRLYERAGAVVVDDEAALDVALAVVALEEDDEALAAVKRLKARGFLVNAVDRSDLCDYTTPAIIDRDPVLIAIGTGGASAGLAKSLRQRLEQLIPGNLGGLASGLSAAREKIKQIWPDGAQRRKAIDAALDPGGALDVLSSGSEANLETWLSMPFVNDLSEVEDM
ncbi:bifunctional precorrin-2 dehydrogenase/sirohydrochlorin ferrochelatase, partial [Parasphingorhabdus sp.]|uniref:precorrin-2 dehydrogenase/sirohydrochlorin ferrochelatase family protein n=1 Tax=Parasphingorhabdus sp. TaxID=2709688 RepID=UPI00309540DC